MDRKVFEAAESGDFESINGLILNSHETLDQFLTPQNKDTVIHVAIRSENKSFAEKALKTCPKLLVTANSVGETPLHTAAKNKNPEMVKLLLRAASIDDDDEERQLGGDTLATMVRARTKKIQDSALHVAVRYGHLEATSLLVNVGLEQLGFLNADGESPLFLAVEGRFFEVARFLMGVCGPLVCDGSNGMNALHAAVIRTHYATILEHHVPDLSLENLRRLIRCFVLHIEEYFGWFYYHKSETDIIELLLQRDESQKTALVEKQDKEIHWTPLHFAAYLGHVEATKLILEQNRCSVAYLRDKQGMSALHIAAKAGHVRVMKEIIRKQPASRDLVDDRGWTVLHIAVEHKKLNVIRFVLKTRKLEFLLNIGDKEGNTALHLAVGRGNLWIINVLVDDARVDKRATNVKYLKPVDILRANPDIGEFFRGWFMKKLERQGGQESLQSIVHRVELTNQITDNKSNDPYSYSEQKPVMISPFHKLDVKAAKSHRLKKISNTHLLVAALIATVTFTAAFTIPGGYTNDEGTAVLSKRPFFKVFVVADSIAFYCASASVLLQFFSSVEHNYHLLLRFTRIAATLTYVSIFGMVVAFASGLRVVIPSSSNLAQCTLIMGALCLFLYIIGCL